MTDLVEIFRRCKNIGDYTVFYQKLKDTATTDEDLKKFSEYMAKRFDINPFSRSFSSSVHGETNVETDWKNYQAEQLGPMGGYRREQEMIQSLDDHIEELTRQIEEASTEEERDQRIKELKDAEVEYAKRRQNLKSSGGGLGAAVKHLEKIEESLQRFWGVIKQFNDPWAKIDHAASQYSKSIGQSKGQYEGMRRDAINAVQRGKLGIKYNASAEDIIKFEQNYSIGAGRNIKANKGEMETIAAMSAVYGDKANELSVLFEKFGVGINDTGEHLGKMFNEATKSGISLEKYTSNVQKGLALAQTYTFAGGLKSMEAMAKKAAKIHMDFQQIQVLADKTSNVEGAITTAAKMQVLGGPFASYADPLGMLSESWGDMEGLANRMEKILAGMGRFDKSTGEVHVDAFNRQRLRAYADATGQSFDQVMEQTHQQAKLGEIRAQISRSSAAGLSKEMRELIENTATFKDGKAGVNITGRGFVALNDLTNDDKKALEIEAQGEAKDIKQIAVDLRSLLDSREGFRKQFENAKAWLSEHLHIGGLEKGLTNLVGKWTPLLVAVAGGGFIAKLAGAGGGVFHSFRGFFKGLFKKGLKPITPGGPKSTVRPVAQTVGGGKGTIQSARGVFGRGGQKGVQTIVSSAGKKYTFDATTGVLRNETGKQLFGKAATNTAKSLGIKEGEVATKKVVESSVKNVTSKQAAKQATKQATKPATKAVSNLGSKVVKGNRNLVAYGEKMAAKGGLKGKAGNFLAKRGTSQLQKMGARTVGKTVSKNVAKKAGLKILGGAAKGGGLGIAGAIGNAVTDAKLENGKWKVGGTKHAIGRIGSTAAEGAALGAMIGSVIPGVGNALGAAIGAVGGAVVGAVKYTKEKRNAALDKKLEHMGIEKHGDYGANGLKKIDKALTSGKKISNRLRRKMEREGDFEMLEAIEAKQAEAKEAKAKKKAERRTRIKNFAKSAVKGAATLIGAASGGKDKISKLKTATFYVDKADFFNKNGGNLDKKKGKLGGILKNATKIYGKGIKGALATTLPGQYINLVGTGIKSGVNILSGHKEKLIPEKIKVPKLLQSVVGGNETNKQSGPIDVNINGTINLTTPNGQSIDIFKELQNNKDLLRQITELIIKKTNEVTNNGYKVKRTLGNNPI